MEPKKNPAKDIHRYSSCYFLIGLTVSIGLLITAFSWQTRIDPSAVRELPSPEFQLIADEVPVVIERHTEPAPPKTIRLINPENIVEASSNFPEPEDMVPVIDENDLTTPSPIAEEIPKEIAPDTFIRVEQMPVPTGGYQNFYQQIARSVRYPAKAKRQMTEGKVFVEFVIDETGEAVNFRVIKGIGSGCDEEAIRVLSFYKWEPGKQRGKPVPVRMVLPVTFRLN